MDKLTYYEDLFAAPSDDDFDPDEDAGDEEDDDELNASNDDDDDDLPDRRTAARNEQVMIELGGDHGPSNSTRAKHSLRDKDMEDIEHHLHELVPLPAQIHSPDPNARLYRDFQLALAHDDNSMDHLNDGFAGYRSEMDEGGNYSASEFSFGGEEDEYTPASDAGSGNEGGGRQSPHIDLIQKSELDDLLREPSDPGLSLGFGGTTGTRLWREPFGRRPANQQYSWLGNVRDEVEQEGGGGGSASRSADARSRSLSMSGSASSARGGAARSSSSSSSSRGGGGGGLSANAWIHMTQSAARPKTPEPTPAPIPTERSPYISARQQARLQLQMQSLVQLVSQLLLISTQSSAYHAEFDAAAIMLLDLRLRRDKARALRAAASQRVAQDAADEDESARTRTRAQHTMRTMRRSLQLNPTTQYDVHGIDRLCAFIRTPRSPRLFEKYGGFGSSTAAFGDAAKEEWGWTCARGEESCVIRTLCPSGQVLATEIAEQSRCEFKREAAEAEKERQDGVRIPAKSKPRRSQDGKRWRKPGAQPPAGCVWDGMAGEWIRVANPSSAAATKVDHGAKAAAAAAAAAATETEMSTAATSAASASAAVATVAAVATATASASASATASVSAGDNNSLTSPPKGKKRKKKSTTTAATRTSKNPGSKRTKNRLLIVAKNSIAKNEVNFGSGICFNAESLLSMQLMQFEVDDTVQANDADSASDADAEERRSSSVAAAELSSSFGEEIAAEQSPNILSENNIGILGMTALKLSPVLLPSMSPLTGNPKNKGNSKRHCAPRAFSPAEDLVHHLGIVQHTAQCGNMIRKTLGTRHPQKTIINRLRKLRLKKFQPNEVSRFIQKRIAEGLTCVPFSKCGKAALTLMGSSMRAELTARGFVEMKMNRYSTQCAPWHKDELQALTEGVNAYGLRWQIISNYLLPHRGPQLLREAWRNRRNITEKTLVNLESTHRFTAGAASDGGGEEELVRCWREYGERRTQRKALRKKYSYAASMPESKRDQLLDLVGGDTLSLFRICTEYFARQPVYTGHPRTVALAYRQRGPSTTSHDPLLLCSPGAVLKACDRKGLECEPKEGAGASIFAWLTLPWPYASVNTHSRKYKMLHKTSKQDGVFVMEKKFAERLENVNVARLLVSSVHFLGGSPPSFAVVAVKEALQADLVASECRAELDRALEEAEVEPRSDQEGHADAEDEGADMDVEEEEEEVEIVATAPKRARFAPAPTPAHVPAPVAATVAPAPAEAPAPAVASVVPAAPARGGGSEEEYERWTALNTAQTMVSVAERAANFNYSRDAEKWQPWSSELRGGGSGGGIVGGSGSGGGGGVAAAVARELPRPARKPAAMEAAPVRAAASVAPARSCLRAATLPSAPAVSQAEQQSAPQKRWFTHIVSSSRDASPSAEGGGAARGAATGGGGATVLPQPEPEQRHSVEVVAAAAAAATTMATAAAPAVAAAGSAAASARAARETPQLEVERAASGQEQQGGAAPPPLAVQSSSDHTMVVGGAVVRWTKLQDRALLMAVKSSGAGATTWDALSTLRKETSIAGIEPIARAPELLQKRYEMLLEMFASAERAAPAR